MVTQKELIGTGWVYNGYRYRNNGQVQEITDVTGLSEGAFHPKVVAQDAQGNDVYATDENGNVIYVNILKANDKVEEYVMPFYKVDYWGKDEAGELINKTVNVSDLSFASRLDTIRSEKRWLAFIIDSKDGYKIQIKFDLNVVTPTRWSTEFNDDKFALTYQDLKNKYTEFTDLTLEF